MTSANPGTQLHSFSITITDCPSCLARLRRHHKENDIGCLSGPTSGPLCEACTQVHSMENQILAAEEELRTLRRGLAKWKYLGTIHTPPAHKAVNWTRESRRVKDRGDSSANGLRAEETDRRLRSFSSAPRRNGRQLTDGEREMDERERYL